MKRSPFLYLVRFAVASCLMGLILSAQSSAQSFESMLDGSGAVPFERPSGFDEHETVIMPAPDQAIAYVLPSGTKILDLQVAPMGGEAALVTETADGRQQLAFWRFEAQKFARSVDIPADVRIASLTWHPTGGALFLLATKTALSRILKIDPSRLDLAPREIYQSPRRLQRLISGPRPFETGARTPEYRLFFGEQLAGGAFALRSVTENGGRVYTVAGPDSKLDDPEPYQAFPPNLAVSLSALPVGFHPAGNVLIWEDEDQCLRKTLYNINNWSNTDPFEATCGAAAAYTPNGAATLEWRQSAAGLRLRGLIDKTDKVILAKYSFTAPPSQTLDGRGIVALTSSHGRTTLVYEPIETPLADVANAWMYLENSADQEKFVLHGGLFRNLSRYDQIYQLYDSESYYCGRPDSRVPTRPYFVTTDLFWEVYGAAFNGLFIVLEREKAVPAFRDFLDAAVADLVKKHANTSLAQAFLAAQAVVRGQETENEEARLILTAPGSVQSPVFGALIDYGEFKPRGPYKTEDQRRYFAAMRYLSRIWLSDDNVVLLRNLDSAVATAAKKWIAAYAPFIVPSRLDLVWGDGRGKSAAASHTLLPGARIFPLSWGWDNEAMDNTIFHADRPPSEQIVATDGAPRLLPSGLDFAAIAGNSLAFEILKHSGLIEKYPNLAARIQVTSTRLKAGTGDDAVSLYEQWLSALGVQWADMVSGPTKGPLWDTKRLQTGVLHP